MAGTPARRYAGRVKPPAPTPSPSSPRDAVGYCGVVVPARRFFQGFWLVRALDAPVAAVLRAAREQARSQTPPPGEAPPDVIRWLPGLDDAADQRAAGTLAAGLATVALRGDARGAVTLGLALRSLTGWDGFWTEAEVHAAGVRTRELARLDGATPEAARAAFGLLPRVVGLRGVQAGERLPDAPVAPPRRGR